MIIPVPRIDVPKGIVCVLICFGAALFYATLVFFIVAGLALYDATRKKARAQENCREFGFQIATTCCCTNNCCTEAVPGEFTHLGGNEYRSTVTGQAIQRTGWSPDGRAVKCACDLGGDGRWFKHPEANVRCLFMPMPAM